MEAFAVPAQLVVAAEPCSQNFACSASTAPTWPSSLLISAPLCASTRCKVPALEPQSACICGKSAAMERTRPNLHSKFDTAVPLPMFHILNCASHPPENATSASQSTLTQATASMCPGKLLAFRFSRPHNFKFDSAW